jgi:hypothetical protein
VRRALSIRAPFNPAIRWFIYPGPFQPALREKKQAAQKPPQADDKVKVPRRLLAADRCRAIIGVVQSNDDCFENRQLRQVAAMTNPV